MELGFPSQRDDVKVSVNYFENPKVVIDSEKEFDYIIDFFDGDKLISQNTIQSNMYYQINRRYHVDWRIRVTIKQTNEIIFDEKYDPTGKKILFDFGSKSIGDILAWLPYVEEYRKKHKCRALVYIPNKLVEDVIDKSKYRELYFLRDGERWTNVYKRFYMAISWDNNTEKDGKDLWRNDFTLHKRSAFFISEQEIATDILGLEYTELKAKVKFEKHRRPQNIPGNYVCISIQSSSQAKYWNYPNGWQTIVDYIKSEFGYSVVCIDKHKRFGNGQTMNELPKGVIDNTGNHPLTERAKTIYHSKFFIGIGSGLSWLSWCVGKPVILISSFSKPHTEFQTDVIRLYNDNYLSGYYNTGTYDRKHWNWNPIMECNTFEDWSRMETITPEQVMKAVKEINTWN